jgi:hypothetical protein
MVEIHLYGKLRNYTGDFRAGQDCVIRLEPSSHETMESLLLNAGIPVDEVNHIFFNAKLHATRTRMASFYGYRQSRSDLADWNLNVPVADGDRIGLFGTDMAMLGM